MYIIMHANMCYFKKKNIMPSGSLGLELIHSKHTKSDQPNELYHCKQYNAAAIYVTDYK